MQKIKPFNVQKGHWDVRVTKIRKFKTQEPYLSEKVTNFKFTIIATKEDRRVIINNMELIAEDLSWFKIKLLSELRKMDF